MGKNILTIEKGQECFCQGCDDRNEHVVSGSELCGCFAPCPSGHITADKRLRFTTPKLPSATSHTHQAVI